MSVLQLNAGKRAVATQFCVDYKYDIGLIQEPNLKSLSDLRRAGSLIVGGDKPRACIVSTSNLCILPQFSSRDIVVAAAGRSIICSFYLAMDDADETMRLLEAALKYGSDRNWSILAAGDANARHPAWGCQQACRRGEQLEKILLDYNLNIANVGDSPTFETGVGKSIIDITISSVPVERWRVAAEQPCGSDHHPITFQIPGLAKPPPEVRRRNWRKAEWKPLIDQLERFAAGRSYPEWSEETLDQATAAMYAAIDKAVEMYVPWKVVNPKHRLWWDDSCAKARTAYKRAKTNFRRNRSDGSLTNLVATKNEYSSAIYAAKERSWQRFVRETEGLDEFAKLKKILLKAKPAELGVLKKADGSYAESMQETVEILLKEHFPGSTAWSKFSNHSNKRQAIEPLTWVNPSIVKSAIMSFKKGKACGPDNVSVELLQKVGPEMIKLLCKIYTASVTIGYTPRLWRSGKTIFINKPAKKDYSEPRAWRPITLLNLPFKALERVIQWRLDEHFRGVQLNDRQYAFRKGRSCDHALSRIVNKLEKAKEQGQFAIYVGLDIVGAYDCLRVDALAAAMRRRGIEEPLVKWVEQFLLERKIVTEIKGEKAEIKVSNGTSQGAVLSTILWNIAYDELIAVYENGPIDFTAYADDGNWIVTGCDLPTMYDLMQKAIDEAVKWAEGMGLRFAPQKTQYMLVTNRRKFRAGKLYIYGKEIDRSRSVHVLGLTIDDKLTFGKHVEERARKAKVLLMSVKPTMARAWGPRPELVRWLLTGVITPIITYACHVWFKALKKKANAETLASVQRLALTLIAPVRTSTPTACLEIIYDTPPIEWAVTKRAKLNALRIKPLLRNLGNWVPKTAQLGHIRMLDNILPETPVPEDGGAPTRLCRRFATEIRDGRPRRADITVYTDGSVAGRKAGSGAVIYVGGHEFLTLSERLEPTSVLHSELNGIRIACEAIQGFMGKSVRIMLDNQAAIRAIERNESSNPWVVAAAEACNQLAKWNYVTLAWVAGHKGHSGNEKADLAAKEGAASDRWSRHKPPETTKEAKKYAHEQILLKWKDAFHKDKRFRQTKLFLSSPDCTIWRSICKMTRDQIGRLIRFVSGHAFVLRTEAVIAGKEGIVDTRCRLCGGETETAEHILRCCPALSQRRFEILGVHDDARVEENGADRLAEFLDCPDVVALEDEVSLFPPFKG